MSSLILLYAKQRKQNEKNKYENRKSQIADLESKMDTVSENYTSVINENVNQLNASLSDGIQGIPALSLLQANTAAYKEKTGSEDSYLSSYSTCLTDEIRECENKISSLETEISSLDRQYHAALAEEKEALRKALQM